MVKITDISNQKNKNKFNLFVDGQFYAGILKETAVANNFFVGKELELSDLDDILIESETKQAFAKASDYLATRVHSKQELKQKLVKKGFSVAAIDKAIEKLEEYGYVDDEEFAKLYAQSNQKLSKQMLKNKLIAKGVSKEIIQKIIEQCSGNQNDLAYELAQKYLRGKDKQTCREKLYAFLQRKGFEYETIKQTIKTIYDVDLDFGE